MAKRHPNHRLVKIHRSYTVEEIATLFGVHKNTVRQWVKGELAAIDNKRPMLVLGSVLVDFLKARRKKNKQKCQAGQLYCVRCRAPKPPAGGMADYSPITDKIGTLIAICPDCGAIMNRHVNLAKIDKILEKMDISFPEALRHIIDRANPAVNSDFSRGEIGP